MRDHNHNPFDQTQCGGRRNPNLITSQSHWHIFRCDCDGNVWHVNGPSRDIDGTVIPVNVDYDCGTKALEAFNRSWTDAGALYSGSVPLPTLRDVRYRR